MKIRLLDPRHFLLPMLGSRFPLEAAVGTNGRVWVHATDTKQVIAIARCIEAVDPDTGSMNESQIETFLREMNV
jgi:exosome complex component RRP40